MKYPEKMRTHCPNCNSHTTHKVHQEGTGQPRSDSWGQRQFRRVKAGYGGQPRPKQKGGPKVSDRAVIVLECTECGKKQVRRGPRTRKMQIGE
ncbi:MAG: 50S ribosomal protein L44e [Candidatus Hadarchaeia archaeon]